MFKECEPKTAAINMRILTPQETEFLDVILHEASTSPFYGPGTRILHAIGIEYKDISYLAWAYDREVPRTSFEWGHSADMAPPLPWPTREAVTRRNKEIQGAWERQREPVPSANV